MAGNITNIVFLLNNSSGPDMGNGTYNCGNVTTTCANMSITHNLKDDTPHEMPKDPIYIYIIVSIFYILIFILGLCGNVLVLIVIFKCKKLHNATNWLLFNLSVADVLVILLCMPTSFVELFSKDNWYFGKVMCFLVPYLECTTAVCSILSIIAISVDRYHAICKSASFNPIASHRNIFKIIIILWIISFVSCIPYLLLIKYDNGTRIDGSKIKMCMLIVDLNLKKAYIITYSCLFYLIPCLNLIVLYGLIGNYISKETMPDQNTGEFLTNSRKVSLAKRRQAISMLKTIASVFFICHLPLHVFRLYIIYASEKHLVEIGFEGYLSIVYFARVAFYLNSAVNPIIYNILSDKFRLSFKQTLSITTRQFSGVKSTTHKSLYFMESLKSQSGSSVKTDNMKSQSSYSLKMKNLYS